MPRYVILFHQLPQSDARSSHWDFMLEQNDMLRTWALYDEPVVGHSCIAVQLADHRTAYLDYEGPVSGGRGRVTRWDLGTYRLGFESADKLQHLGHLSQ